MEGALSLSVQTSHPHTHMRSHLKGRGPPHLQVQAGHTEGSGMWVCLGGMSPMAGGLPQRVSGHQKQADGSGPSISSSHLSFSPPLKQVRLRAFHPTEAIHRKEAAGAHFSEEQRERFSSMAGWTASRAKGPASGSPGSRPHAGAPEHLLPAWHGGPTASPPPPPLCLALLPWSSRHPHPPWDSGGGLWVHLSRKRMRRL